jgi:hypothetical protein
MKTQSNKTELLALENLIAEAYLIVSTTEPLPENRTSRCCELLNAALALTNDLLKQEEVSPLRKVSYEHRSAITFHASGNN